MLSDGDIHAPWLTAPIEQRRATLSPGRDYPLPIVDHGAARNRTLTEFKSGYWAAKRTPPWDRGMNLRYDASQHSRI